MEKITINPKWQFKEKFPTISAYTYVLNATKNDYPFEASIRSFSWVDELIVVDAGSEDKTMFRLNELKKEIPNLKIFEMKIDNNDPGRDGAMKSLARAMCSSEFCIQFDSDEICRGDVLKWKRLAKEMPKDIEMLNLFVAEPIGSPDNLRMNKEHTPWKWRLSRNLAHIVHSIPDYDRIEKDGKVHSKGMSDGCFPVNIVNNKPIQSYNPPYLKNLTELKNKRANEEYASRIEQLIKAKEPYVLHLGHISLENKIKLYLRSWHNWWCFLYDKDPSDPCNNQYFPGMKPDDIGDNMIEAKAEEILENTPTIKLDVLNEEYCCAFSEKISS